MKNYQVGDVIKSIQPNVAESYLYSLVLKINEHNYKIKSFYSDGSIIERECYIEDINKFTELYKRWD